MNHRNQLVIVAILCLLVGTGGGYVFNYASYQSKIMNYEKQVSDLTLQITELNSTVLRQMSQNLVLEANVVTSPDVKVRGF